MRKLLISTALTSALAGAAAAAPVQTYPNATQPYNAGDQPWGVQNGNAVLFSMSGLASYLSGAGNLAPHVATNAALIAAATTTYPNGVWRDDFSTGFGAPPLFYQPSNSVCSLNAGAGDNGSQVQSADSKCWKAAFPPGGQRIEWWGINQTTVGGDGVIPGTNGLTLYVASGSATPPGSDQLGANTCVQSAHPCGTWNHAMAQAALFDVEGGIVLIHDTDTTNQNFAESLEANGSLRGATNALPWPSGEAINPGEIVLDGNGHATLTGASTVGGISVCYTVAANNGGILGLENITVKNNAGGCSNGGNDFFAQQNGNIDLYNGVHWGQAGSAAYRAHVESSAVGIQIWGAQVIDTGTDLGWMALGPSGAFTINVGAFTITPTSVCSNTCLLVDAGSVFQTDVANPFGASPGAATGPAFFLLPGGAINTQALQVAWPGSTAGVIMGGVYRGDGLITGTVPSCTAVTGAGSTATCGVGKGNTRRGTININVAGAGISSSGTFTLSFPFLLKFTDASTAGTCSFAVATGTGTWSSGALIIGASAEASPGAGAAYTWTNNGNNLTTAQQYNIIYTCDAGS